MACRSPPQPRYSGAGNVSPGYASPVGGLSPRPGYRPVPVAVRGPGYTSPPRRGAGYQSPPRFGSPPRLSGTPSAGSLGYRKSQDSASRPNLKESVAGHTCSTTSLISSDSGAGVKAVQLVKRQAPVPASGWQAQTPVPASGWQVQQMSPTPSMPSGPVTPAHPGGPGAGLFGRIWRSPASAAQDSIPADSPAHLPMAVTANIASVHVQSQTQASQGVAKPTWIIEEVVDFGPIPEESDQDYEPACHPRAFPFLGGCALWECEEEVEDDNKEYLRRPEMSRSGAA